MTPLYFETLEVFHLAFMSFATVIYLNVKNSLKVFRKQKRHGIFSLDALGAEGKSVLISFKAAIFY